MKYYRPLLFQELDVRIPGARIRRLRLNRHLPEVDLLAEHEHSFGQILCYLSGRGTMTVADKAYEIGPASIIFLPPRAVHSFREATGRRPLCLVLDIDWRGAVKHGVSLARMSQSEAGSIRRELSELTRLHEPNAPTSRLIVAAVVLRILDSLLRSLGVLPPHKRETPSFVRQFDRLLRDSTEPLPEVAELAAKMGYNTDHLNRLFRPATGRTLREYRDAFFIERAQRLLRSRPHVKDACEELGFLDQNYFARWFKKHTGLTPTAFQRQA